MKTYIDIGAQRIQTWISRPLKLKYVRGASLKLSEETGAEKISQWLGQENVNTFKVSTDAGNIDGVVVLEAPTELLADGEASEVANKLMLHLDQAVPNVEWQGWACEAPDFLSAYKKAVVSHEPDEEFFMYPSVMEFTGVLRCEGCQSELVRRKNFHVDEYLGPDCEGRLEVSKAADAKRARHLRGEEGEASAAEYWPEDFEELAARKGRWASHNGEVPGYKTRPRNHIATICADGNRIGALFEELGKHDELANFKTQAVGLLSEVTKGAVEKASRAVMAEEGKTGEQRTELADLVEEASTAATDDTPKTVTLVHYVGGDDVLVSVTADEAWTFAVRLIEYFEDLQKQLLGKFENPSMSGEVKAKIEKLIREISLGVGLVFSHYAHPFYECRHKAEEALSYAKQKTAGKSSAICWMDLTEDGGDTLHTTARHVIDYETAYYQVEDGEMAPTVIKLNSTARHNLLGQWVTWLQEDNISADQITKEQLAKYSEYIKEWMARTGRVGEIPVQDLEADLSRARWWPYVATDEGETQ